MDVHCPVLTRERLPNNDFFFGKPQFCGTPCICYLRTIKLDPAHEPVEDLDITVDGDVDLLQLLVPGHLPRQSQLLRGDVKSDNLRLRTRLPLLGLICKASLTAYL